MTFTANGKGGCIMPMPMMIDLSYLAWRPWLIPLFILRMWWEFIGKKLLLGILDRLAPAEGA